MIGSNRQSDNTDKSNMEGREQYGKVIDAFQALTDRLNENKENQILPVEYDSFRLCDIENQYQPWRSKANLLAHQAHHITNKYSDKSITLTLIDDCGQATQEEISKYLSHLKPEDCKSKTTLNSLKEFNTHINKARSNYEKDPDDIITPTHTLFFDFPMLLPKNVNLKLQTYLRLNDFNKDKLCKDSIKSIQGTGLTQKNESLKTIFNQVSQQVIDKYGIYDTLLDHITQPFLHQYMYNTLCQHHLSEYIDNEIKKLTPTNPLSSHRNQLTYYNFLNNATKLITYLQKQLLQQKDTLSTIDKYAYQTTLNLLQLERIYIIQQLKKSGRKNCFNEEDALLNFFSKQYNNKQYIQFTNIRLSTKIRTHTQLPTLRFINRIYEIWRQVVVCSKA